MYINNLLEDAFRTFGEPPTMPCLLLKDQNLLYRECSLSADKSLLLRINEPVLSLGDSSFYRGMEFLVKSEIVNVEFAEQSRLARALVEITINEIVSFKHYAAILTVTYPNPVDDEKRPKITEIVDLIINWNMDADIDTSFVLE